MYTEFRVVSPIDQLELDNLMRLELFIIKYRETTPLDRFAFHFSAFIRDGVNYEGATHIVEKEMSKHLIRIRLELEKNSNKID